MFVWVGSIGLGIEIVLTVASLPALSFLKEVTIVLVSHPVLNVAFSVAILLWFALMEAIASAIVRWATLELVSDEDEEAVLLEEVALVEEAEALEVGARLETLAPPQAASGKPKKANDERTNRTFFLVFISFIDTPLGNRERVKQPEKMSMNKKVPALLREHGSAYRCHKR